ncbi:MAG: hypothetical protein V4581_05655 [Bacteroidota bacterium]
MKSALLLLPLLFLLACKNDKQQLLADATPTFKDVRDYTAFKDSVTLNKKQLVNKPYAELSEYFFHLVNDDIYSYWQGTPWAFYGMTRTPNEGTIACGYFVTNTLADLGFKIDNVKLAQDVSATMIKKLCVDINTFNGIKNFATYMDTQPVNSVYIIGLDYHTGYVVKDATGSYFLHSNYIGKEGVVKELITESRALAKNKFFMIGSLTGNKKRLQQWAKE